LARTTFSGRGLPYLAAISATTLILVMAANTAYADFPRLSAVQAADGFLPRQLTYRGSRLVYSRGIVVLALVACALIAIFNASAWIIIILVPALVSVFFAIHRHYRELAVELSLEDYGATPRVLRHRVLIAISGVHRGTVEALRYANALSDDITAVYVSVDAQQ